MPSTLAFGLRTEAVSIIITTLSETGSNLQHIFANLPNEDKHLMRALSDEEELVWGVMQEILILILILILIPILILILYYTNIILCSTLLYSTLLYYTNLVTNRWLPPRPLQHLPDSHANRAAAS